MIPVTLRLRNFLSYGEDVDELDFSGFDIACVSGKNGHGKSALFDAITWSLWGEARKAGNERKADAGLVRSGALEARVEFVFDLQGNRYRVIRTFRKRPSGGVAGLELQVYDSATERYQPLSESGSVRLTQAKIHALLGMGYDTFVNSALLLQGQADAFTRRSPADRKAVLSEILELHTYDKLADAARIHLSEARSRAAEAKRRLTDIEETAARFDALSRQCEEQEACFEKAGKTAKEADRDLSAARVRAGEHERCRVDLSQTRAERQRLSKEVKEVRNQIGSARHRRRAADRLLEYADTIRAQSEQRDLLERQMAELTRRRVELTTATVEKTELEAKIARARQSASHRLDLCHQKEAHAAEAVAHIESILERSSDVTVRARELAGARAEDERLNRLLEDQRSLQSKLDRARTELAKASTVRQSALASLAREAERLCRAADGSAQNSRIADLEKKANKVRSLEETRVRLQDEAGLIEKAQTAREVRLSEWDGALARFARQTEDLSRADGDCPVCGTLLDDEHRNEAIERINQDRVDLARERAHGLQEMADARSEQGALSYALMKNERSLDKLAHIQAELVEARLARKQAECARKELAAVQDQLRTAEAALRSCESSGPEALACERFQAAIDTLDYDAKEHEHIRKEIEDSAHVDKELQAIDSAQKEKPRCVSALDEARAHTREALGALEADDFEPAARERLHRVETWIAGIDYDQAHHRAIEEEARTLSSIQDALEQLRTAERERATADIQIQTLENQLETLQPRLAACEKRTGELERELEANEVPAQHLQDLSDQATRASENRDRALETVAGLRRDRQTCAEQIRLRPDVTAEVKKAEYDAVLYEHLITAFGRDGIPALIIEQAIPEIEAEANLLLARLTNDQTRVILDSIRSLKGGGTRESFDIRIVDEHGERPYELYSGGEAFRVDFALRIALSRLLARRTGAPLQTLVIDEGFGTQDSEGVDRLVDAIGAIREDFAKILVISHVEAIKDAFPVTIAVTKSADHGSSFQVIR